MKTEQQIQEFLNLPDIELNNLDSNQSFKTNLSIGTRNFKLLVLYLSKTLSFIKNLYEMIDVSNIVNSVLTSLETKKNILNIDVNLVIGTSVIQNIDNKIFRISRVDNFHVIITSENILNWNTDNLIIQVKTIDGMIVYPTILTIENKIELYFNDILSTNYKIFWI